jgi:hypothetical protein
MAKRTANGEIASAPAHDRLRAALERAKTVRKILLADIPEACRGKSDLGGGEFHRIAHACAHRLMNGRRHRRTALSATAPGLRRRKPSASSLAARRPRSRG